MHCDAQTLFVVVIGIITSQYLVWHFVNNQSCIQNMEKTLYTIWKKYYKDSCCENYHLWKQNSASRIQKKLQAEQQNLILLFYLWNLMWVIMLCFCLPRIWALSLLSVMTTYGFMVITASYITYYMLMTNKEKNVSDDMFLPNFYI